MRRAPQILLLLAVLALAVSSFPEDVERHLADASTAPLCSRSAFLHGYIHGYEDGFHEGNLDLLMGHRPRPLNSIKPYRHLSGYRDQFGDRGFFRSGYQSGFRAAYYDAINDGVFRGFTQLRVSGEDLNVAAETTKNSAKEFDRALVAGYDAGHAQGQTARRPPASFDYVAQQCGQQRRPANCDAYARGFRLGFADAWARHRDHVPETQTAKK